MASKYQTITDMAEQVSYSITESAEKWMRFLTTAANNYKYRFKDQLLIFAQKPGATACADIETWNRLSRWVNKGTKGIALLIDRDVPYKLRYVFDVSDTNSRAGHNVSLWQMTDRYADSVVEALENSFGEVENKSGFVSVLLETAKNVVEDNISDYLSDLLSVKKDSLLEDINNLNTEVWFKEALTSSISFMLLTRCAINPREHFSYEEFSRITDFNTPETVSILGGAVSDISEMVLREIAATVKNLQMEEQKQVRTFAKEPKIGENISENKTAEGSFKNGNDLYNAGRLSDSRPDRSREPEAVEVWNAAAQLSAQTPERDLHWNAAVGQAEQPPYGNRPAGKRDDGAPDNTDGEDTGRDREPESVESDAVGSEDEQHSQRGGGNRSDRADLQLTETLPTVEEQQNVIAESEAENASDFSISQEDIDAVLTRGSGVCEGKYRIYEQLLKQESAAENIKFLKNEYGIGGSYPAVSNRKLDEGHDGKGIKISRGSIMEPDAELLLTWSKAEKRIGELIKADRYLSAKEKEHYPTYRRETETRAARDAIGEEFCSIIRDYNVFETQLGNTDACLNQYVLIDCGSCFGIGDKKTYCLTMDGDFILPLMRDALHTIIAKNTHLTERCENLLSTLGSDIAKPLEPIYDELNPPPEPEKEYRFSLGDTIYLGANEYEILAFDNETVRLYDTSFPLLNKELTRAEFKAKLSENPMNDHLLQAVETSQPVQIHEEEPAEKEDVSDIKASEEAVLAVPEPLEVPRQKPKVRTQTFDLHPEISQTDRHNFHIADDTLGVGTASERYQNNVAAIRLLRILEDENRFATPTEQEVLAKYVGWGGLSDCFDERHSKYGELKSLLSEDEYSSARESTLTAFYTPPVVIRSIYKALENMNFMSGNILEPSCGVGNFLGMLPESMKSSRLYGVELDSVSGRITQQLYQKSSIAVQGFEKTDLPDSFFDAAIGNVPFGQFKVPDKRYDKHNFLIHDYFFARALDKVRPGGIIAFITSKGTMDKENPAVRKYIAQRADLLGAIRLPNDTFKSAAGTEVTSDIIFLQKRDRLIDIEPGWVHLNTDENGVTMNQYFIDNPDMILGKMKMVSGPFGPESACIPYEGQSLDTMLGDAIQNIHAEVTEYDLEDLAEDEEDQSVPADPSVRNFSYVIVDGKLYYRENSRMNPVDVSVTAENRIKGMIAIRDCVRTLIEYQTEDYPENEGNFVRKADMFSRRTIKQKSVITSVDTASEALSVSLAEKARVDLPFMAQLTGETEDQVITDLVGVIFLNVGAADRVYVTADEYLSGNVREKLRLAKAAAKMLGDYSLDSNIRALEAVQPADLTASEISVRLGATWLPPEVVEQFVFELFSTPRYCQWNIKVHYSEYTGEWNIEGKSYDRGNIKAYNTYGITRINGYKIIEETLNLRDVRIFDYVEDAEGRKQAILNRKETAIAQGKQELIKSAFTNWIWKDPNRREKLCRLYNEKFNSNRARENDGSFLTFVGINPEITLRRHQVDAIARTILGGNTLLAHVVGAGKVSKLKYMSKLI